MIVVVTVVAVACRIVRIAVVFHIFVFVFVVVAVARVFASVFSYLLVVLLLSELLIAELFVPVRNKHHPTPNNIGMVELPGLPIPQ